MLLMLGEDIVLFYISGGEFSNASITLRSASFLSEYYTSKMENTAHLKSRFNELVTCFLFLTTNICTSHIYLISIYSDLIYRIETPEQIP